MYLKSHTFQFKMNHTYLNICKMNNHNSNKLDFTKYYDIN